MSRLLESQQMLHCALFYAGRIPGTRILSITRTPSAVDDDQLDPEMDLFEGQLARVDRNAHHLLLDLRAEDDDATGAAHLRYQARRDQLLRGFERVAVLTSVGAERDHFARRSNSHPGEIRVFYDEKVAMGWLRGTAPQ